ncbi:ChaN family lipoprotein [Primorskyibacter sp. 2E233]|uniref:ChaN family lipoprotein n=1 Tax=Primorskyibacter sp. 2E233 TaxID=3413431 RepID=UPI003BF27344
MKILSVAMICLASAVSAGADLSGDVVFLGEQHDNPAHHARQADLVGQLAPKALVFEMLTDEQAAKVTPDLVPDAKALGEALEWEAAGWPDFDWYHPIFLAAPDAAIYGAAVPREAARGLMGQGLPQVFGDRATEFGLTDPLPEAQQEAREAMQLSAHCDALPAEMLPVMVSIQRLRDASLARAALQAFLDSGGPVVVITGNGHARKDWGAPAALALAAPDLAIKALGQGEEGSGAPTGAFDLVEFSPPVQRDDPCEAFLKQRGN